MKDLTTTIREVKGAYDNHVVLQFHTDNRLFAGTIKTGTQFTGYPPRNYVKCDMGMKVKASYLWQLIQSVTKTGDVRLGWHRSVCGKNNMTGEVRYMDGVTATDNLTRILCVADSFEPASQPVAQAA